LIQPDEIYLSNFPFGDTAGMKLRPVLCLTGPIGTAPEVLVAYISSIIPQQLLHSDIILDPSDPQHTSTHLKTRSVLRLHKLATVHQTSITRRLGTISLPTSEEVKQILRDVLKL
jgi:mRNA interferase MazF